MQLAKKAKLAQDKDGNPASGSPKMQAREEVQKLTSSGFLTADSQSESEVGSHRHGPLPNVHVKGSKSTGIAPSS
jgi:hypothetical protein